MNSNNKENSEYSFTPKPAIKTKANHAWERKPATPFAARNEHQKIWKRYDLPGEQSQRVEIRRRKSPMNNKRSVKKMKLRHTKTLQVQTRMRKKQKVLFMMTRTPNHKMHKTHQNLRY